MTRHISTVNAAVAARIGQTKGIIVGAIGVLESLTSALAPLRWSSRPATTPLA